MDQKFRKFSLYRKRNYLYETNILPPFGIKTL